MGPVGPEPVAILKHPSGTVINLILNAAKANSPNVLMDVVEKHAGYTHVALAITSVERMERGLREEGVTITEGPVKSPGGTSIFVRDPDGNVVEFHEESR